MIYLSMAFVLAFSWILPWWWVACVGGFVGWRGPSAARSAITAFAAITLAEIPVAYYFDLKAYGLISKRIGEMFHLPWDLLAYLVAAIPTALLAASAALTGFYGRQALRKRQARVKAV